MNLLSQKVTVEFHGSILDMARKTPAAETTIFILEDSDTAYIGKTDENGKFKIKLTLDKNKKWKTIGRLYFRKSELVIYDPRDSCKYNFDNLVFSFDLVLLKYCTLRDPTIYYEINTTDNPKNLDIVGLKELLTQYPNARFEYSQTVSKKEKTEIAQKRMAAFKSHLEKNGISTSNITFSDKVYYLNESDPDQCARVEGIVINLE